MKRSTGFLFLHIALAVVAGIKTNAQQAAPDPSGNNKKQVFLSGEETRQIRQSVITDGKIKVIVNNIWLKKAENDSVYFCDPGEKNSYVLVSYHFPVRSKQSPERLPMGSQDTSRTWQLKSVALSFIDLVAGYVKNGRTAIPSFKHAVKTDALTFSYSENGQRYTYGGPSFVEIYRYSDGHATAFNQGDYVTVNPGLTPVSFAKVMKFTTNALKSTNPNLEPQMTDRLIRLQAKEQKGDSYWMGLPEIEVKSHSEETTTLPPRWWGDNYYLMIFNPKVGVVGRCFEYFSRKKGPDILRDQILFK